MRSRLHQGIGARHGAPCLARSPSHMPCQRWATILESATYAGRSRAFALSLAVAVAVRWSFAAAMARFALSSRSARTVGARSESV